MEWLNEPASWQRTGDVLTVSVDPSTDFWRETGYGYIRDSGHVYGEVLAGVFATYLGRKAWYKDGGSTKEHAAVMAPHLLQWEVMRWLRARGVDAYDLVAVPPAAELKPSHPLYGLYRFKSGFSERITEYVGTWDLPIRQRRYAAWNSIAERAAHQWAYRVRHDLLY